MLNIFRPSTQRNHSRPKQRKTLGSLWGLRT
jgi:hypothetical protein